MSLTDLQRDILIKAAEGIQEGMWCRDYAFANSEEELSSPRSLFSELITKERAQQSHRCATGELALRTVELGGARIDYRGVELAVITCLEQLCVRCDVDDSSIEDHNDNHMTELDQFSAGQEWARIFREVADA